MTDIEHIFTTYNKAISTQNESITGLVSIVRDLQTQIDTANKSIDSLKMKVARLEVGQSPGE